MAVWLIGVNTGVCNLISFSSVSGSVFVRDMGERYRREMLAHGGAKEPMLMVEGNCNLFVQPLFIFKVSEPPNFITSSSQRLPSTIS